jgi:hypothetical protein
MNVSRFKVFYHLLLAIALAFSFNASAQENGDAGEQAKEESAKEEKGEESKPKTIAELTKDAVRHDGFFTLFQDPKTGETSMLIKADQVGKEFIYWVQVANGPIDGGYFKGMYGPSGMVSIRRHFDRIEFVAENHSFYFDPDNAISRASEANISDSLLAVAKIAAEDEESGDILIKSDKLFKSEAFAQITPSPNPDADPKKDFSLGKLNAEKTKILGLRSYPLNTDVEVEYVFSNPQPKVFVGPQVTDERNVSVRVMHSFIEAPENDYQPRADDARMGFFTVQVTDLTSTEAAPWRDVIRRWHLVKKDPDAALSEPVEPITWWIENTTPVEWRELIRESALRWNQSFEKAGFKNALVVKIQPDDAEWDAGDIRYNVLRWTSSPTPLFGGYGPSFSDPRTGQQLGADVMLEFSFMNRAIRARQFMQDDPSLHAFGKNDDAALCSLGHNLQLNSVFAMTAAEVAGYADDDELNQRLTHDTMSYLILHEIGHTLAMYHNMKATNLLSPEEAFDAEVVAERGLAGSVMDYPAINFAPTREQQTQFYNTHPGPFDDWLIEYGYSPALDDPEAEAARLEAILSRSNEPGLAFGNDADDMRAPGGGIDPRVNIYDMSTDAVTYASNQMTLMKDTLQGMVDHVPDEGKSYQETLEGATIMMRFWGRAAAVVSRFVGGVYVDRSVVGQDGGQDPFTPVGLSKQRQAMEVLSEQVFAPAAFELPPELLRRMAAQRRGADHFGGTEDPKVHDGVLGIQNGVLDHLLNPVVMKRITDSALYGNRYSLAEMMGDLTDAIFEADARGNVNTMRQNLQMSYVQRLAKMMSNGYDTPSRSIAVYTLNEISDLLDGKRGNNISTQAHTQNLKLVIERALDTSA